MCDPSFSRHQYPSDATLSGGPFLTPDFTTSSTTALITHTTANGSLTEVYIKQRTLVKTDYYYLWQKKLAIQFTLTSCWITFLYHK